MYNFILQTIVMFSLGAIVYLVARTSPRVTETTASAEPSRYSQYLEKFLKKLPLEKMDAFFNTAFGKLLRNFKIAVMKLDNFLNKKLQDLKPAGGNGADKPALFDNSVKIDAGAEPALIVENVENKEESDNLNK